ncbi:ZIP family metal transporter [Giesbergeria anulus]|uniref:Zinc and cadmium transporter n=1 Tax=Giesbergeria anulus TaxID=180197 RepID=A0A1H9I2Y0_9BURK|nr:ZIP family metal transporter [Giesbergeria anulus]SEQ68949.1 zinc and cadmium transporter [Giesbergeria anulus]
MVLFTIIIATLVTGIGSVWIAALLLRTRFGGRSDSLGPQYLLSLAAGALLATSFMHLLPEAFESQAGAHDLFTVLLLGVVFFFLLDKAELWHHGHEHNHDAPAPQAPTHPHSAARHEHGASPHHHDHHHHDHSHPANGGGLRTGGWTLITGDSVHCFGDGVLIASAFMADLRLGLIAAVSVLAHEVPHHIGDLVVLRQSSANRRMALVKVSLAGAVTAIGGLVGYFLVAQLQDWLPYFLALASSSFIYVALADLIPQLQKRLSARETAAQIAWLLLGMGVVVLLSSMAHSH